MRVGVAGHQGLPEAVVTFVVEEIDRRYGLTRPCAA